MCAPLPVFNNLFSAHLLLPVFIGIVAIVVKNYEIFLKCPGRTFSADSPEAVRQPSATRFLDTFGLCSTLCGLPSCL